MNQIQFLRLLPLLIVLAISALLATGLLNTHITRGAMINKIIPAFNIDLVATPQIKMTQETWKGQVAIINIFASWCKPCQQEHATLMRLAQTGKANVYGIAWRDTAPNIVKYLNALGNPYQQVGNDEFGRSTIPFALTGVPETLVVDRDGKVYYHYVSALTDDEVNKNIIPLIDRLNTTHLSNNTPRLAIGKAKAASNAAAR